VIGTFDPYTSSVPDRRQSKTCKGRRQRGSMRIVLAEGPRLEAVPLGMNDPVRPPGCRRARSPATPRPPVCPPVLRSWSVTRRADTVAGFLERVAAVSLHPRTVGVAAALNLLVWARERGVGRVVTLWALNADDEPADQPSRCRGDRAGRLTTPPPSENDRFTYEGRDLRADRRRRSQYPRSDRTCREQHHRDP